jgi:hypothetical protein
LLIHYNPRSFFVKYRFSYKKEEEEEEEVEEEGAGDHINSKSG